MKIALTLARKEFNALGGAWLAIAAAIAAGELPEHNLRAFEIVFYISGCATLGALSIGQEYRYRTLPQLLALPVPRTMLLAVKTAILSVFVLTLTALVYTVAFSGTFSIVEWDAGHRGEYRAVLVLPVIYALVVAPLLTLKTRNTLAGALFACSIGGLLYVAGDRIGAARSVVPFDIEQTRLTVTWIGSWFLCAAAAAGLWRSVHDWQAVEDVRSDVALPAILRLKRSTGLERSNPLLLLVGKELHLQQLTLVASLLYAVLYVAGWAQRATLLRTEDALVTATLIHAIVVGTLAGAFACGEERVLGTLEWQLLQPVSARAQFAVKAVTALGLTLLLTFGVPALLSTALHGAPTWQKLGYVPIAIAAISYVAGSMYVSSVAPSSVSGLLLCVPSFLVGLMFVQNVVREVARSPMLRTFQVVPGGRVSYPHHVGGRVDALLWVALVWVVLALAFDNYRQADRPLRRPALQLLGLAALVTMVTGGFAAAGWVL